MTSTLLISSLGMVSPAWAQPADDDVQESTTSPVPDATGGEAMQNQTDNAEEQGAIVVTGSRIQRRDLTSTSPLAVVQDEEFTLSGAVNVEQVLNQLPQVYPSTGGFSNNPGGGVATLDLRGLGNTRTLILVNGRRYVFYDVNQLVDVNTIPQFLIDSVDVVTGGASAVYGSDAVGGVVNFRLQTDLEGFKAGTQYSITEEGDGRRYGAHLAVGAKTADGRGSVVAFGEYFKREPIFQLDRDFSRFSTSQATGIDVCVDPATVNPRTRIGTVVGSIIQTGANAGSCATGEPGFGAAGSGTNQFGRFRYTGSAGPRGFFNGTGAQFDVAGGPARQFSSVTDAYNFAPENYIMVPQERFLLGGYGEFEINDALNVFTEVTYVNNVVTTVLAATPVTGTFDFNVAQTCQFINAANCAQLQDIDANETGTNKNNGIVRLNTNRRTLEASSRFNEDERNAFRVLAGLKGDITDNLNYEAYYLFARTRNSQLQTGGVSRTAFQNGLNGVGTPINIFGPGTLTPAMVQQITVSASNTDISQLQVASGSLSGTFGNFGLGAEDIGFAAGVEYRSVSSEYRPDPVSGSGDIIGPNFGQATAGGYNVKEAFVEIRVPIIAERPFFHQLTLEGAFRYSDYSLSAVGGVETYSAGVTWAPIRDVTLRGQYQRAIRAPNVSELFGGQSNGFPSATDPCAQASAATNATVRQLCIQTGVPAALVGNELVQTQSQIEALFGGNPNLEEERSETYTLGAVIRPSFIPRLNIAIDGYDITVDNAISVFGGGLNNTLDICYNVVQDISSPFCQTFVGARDPESGEITDPFFPVLLNANTASLETRGIDLQIDYSQPLGFSLIGGEESRLNFAFAGTYLDRYRFRPSPLTPDLVTECRGRFGISFCDEPYAKFKWTSRLTLIDGPVTLSGRWRHLSAVRDDDDETFYTVERIGAYDLFDLSAAFDIGDNFTLAMGVNNILDKQPPLLGTNQEQANTYTSTYDPLGRDFFVSASIRF
ncbi:MAG TPA: TonB-dependent receptor [Allosphingosinicella sp.]